jgi:CRP/FNR family cyclic AMP-dependent transcriptional regulator
MAMDSGGKNKPENERLRDVAILSSLSDEELGALASAVTWIEVTPDQEVLSHLTEGTQVYFVVEGEFRTMMTTAYGRTVAIGQLNPGSHFGEIAALTGAPRTLSVVANTAGLVAECPAEAFLAAMRGNARFAEAVAASLARRVVLLTDRLFELAALEMRFRVYSELLRLARGGEETPEGVLIRNAPTHDMIAAAIGAQREAVNRELRYLVGEKIIRQARREIVVLNMERLREMVQKRAGLTATQIVDWRF